MAIGLLATITVLEGKNEAFEQTFLDLTEKVRANEPGNVFYALGMWHPAADDLRSIRDRIDSAPDEWRDVRENPDFTGTYEWAGESLKRAPKGYALDHPDIEDLRRKDFIGVAPLAEEDAGRPDLLPFLASQWSKGDALMRFLSGAVNVPF